MEPDHPRGCTAPMSWKEDTSILPHMVTWKPIWGPCLWFLKINKVHSLLQSPAASTCFPGRFASTFPWTTWSGTRINNLVPVVCSCFKMTHNWDRWKRHYSWFWIGTLKSHTFIMYSCNFEGLNACITVLSKWRLWCNCSAATQPIRILHYETFQCHRIYKIWISGLETA